MRNVQQLLEMLQYKRPEGSITQEIFCEKYLDPVFGEPDPFGNYIHVVYNKDGTVPRVCFTAHHDTVHRGDGVQKVIYDTFMDVVYTEDSNCLGADCTTGIWLILNMIDEGVPGIYVVHAAEEVGCLGSEQLVKNFPAWLLNTDAVISFDRYGQKSVITHQMGVRTASDEFAESLARVLDLDTLVPDSGGSYTDSNEYRKIVPECTNLSVGYYDQHTKKEFQDLSYLMDLRDALLEADWSGLVIKRDPSVVEYDDDRWGNMFRGWGGSYRDEDYEDFGVGSSRDKGWPRKPRTLVELVSEYPEEVAELFDTWGWTVDGLIEDLGFKYAFDDKEEEYEQINDRIPF